MFENRHAQLMGGGPDQEAAPADDGARGEEAPEVAGRLSIAVGGVRKQGLLGKTFLIVEYDTEQVGATAKETEP